MYGKRPLSRVSGFGEFALQANGMFPKRGIGIAFTFSQEQGRRSVMRIEDLKIGDTVGIQYEMGGLINSAQTGLASISALKLPSIKSRKQKAVSIQS